MPNVTFISILHKDKTVYAVAGSHTKTLLALAKENHIPIDFNCQDGECGTCVVKVTNLSMKGPMGGHITDREIKVLKELAEELRQLREESRPKNPPTPQGGGEPMN